MKFFRKNRGCSVRISPSRRGFTLMEVMLACGILFMCLFGILALVSNSLNNARALQQHKAVDVGTIASMIYVELANTNSVTEGDIPVDLSDTLPGYKCFSTLTQIGTNGLCQIDFEVERNSKLELQSHFLMFLPTLKQGGISATLPQH
jgi:Tfp pilus assembly protein PilV